jgi:2-polyprenyl-6-methoxyphenol hydroxylase-like FAD-dependent oxidoreductase
MGSYEKAIIIGGGISGKLAARVLSDFFEEVLILERDQEAEGPFPRKGARQGEHLHALLHAGQYGLEELFPGITEKFHQSGAVKINSTKDLAWFHHGAWKLRYDGGYTTTLQTRPHLEWHMNQYIKDIPNVTVLFNKEVKDYIYQADDNRIYGVEVKDLKDGAAITLTADLIVDASGSSSISAAWFKKAGVQIPIEKVDIGLSYVSQMFQLTESQSRDWTIKLVYPNPPLEKIGGTISKVENNRYMVTVIGYQNEIQEKEVLKSEGGFRELTKRLPKLDIYEEITSAVPLTNISVYRVPQITWKRFEKMKELPKGLLLIGDTVCRIDPVFGQGMSIAVIEALALQEVFKSNQDSFQSKITSFHKKVSRIIKPIWEMVIAEDFRYPGVTGKKPFALSIRQWYAKRIFLLSAQSEEVYDSFIKVMNLTRPMEYLFRVPVVARVLSKFKVR